MSVTVRLRALALAVESFAGIQMTPKTETILTRAKAFSEFALEGSSANGAGPQAAPPNDVAKLAGTGPVPGSSAVVALTPKRD